MRPKITKSRSKSRVRQVYNTIKQSIIEDDYDYIRETLPYFKSISRSSFGDYFVTFIDIAASFDQLHTIKLLMKYDSEPDENLNRILYIASASGSVNVVKYALSCGALDLKKSFIGAYMGKMGVPDEKLQDFLEIERLLGLINENKDYATILNSLPTDSKRLIENGMTHVPKMALKLLD